ncbi:MAG TPA: SRPBCC domain-containing protein [Bauldia sp.]|nr:SRPBCC domain-containing protein [Bauldia sp.]
MPEPVEANSARAVREGSVDDRTLVIERVFKAPPDQVFRAWTDPEILVDWWGPEGFGTRPAECAMDLREGGAWRTVMRNERGEAHIASGVYREISPPRRLVLTWGWQQPDGSRGHETVVELNFESVPGGTRLRLVQRVFASSDQRDSHRMGWQSSLDKLERMFA